MKLHIIVEADLVVIPSRHNAFWYELVLVYDSKIIDTFGQYRTEEEAQKAMRVVADRTMASTALNN